MPRARAEQVRINRIARVFTARVLNMLIVEKKATCYFFGINTDCVSEILKKVNMLILKTFMRKATVTVEEAMGLLSAVADTAV